MIEISFLELLGALGICGANITIVSIFLHLYRELDSRDINTYQISEHYRPPPATEGTKPSNKTEWILWITTISLTVLTVVVTGWEFMKFAGIAIAGSLIGFGIFYLLDLRLGNPSEISLES